MKVKALGLITSVAILFSRLICSASSELNFKIISPFNPLIPAKMAVLRYSLVKWLSGDDSDSMTVVESKCVRGFDFTEHEADGKPSVGFERVNVEWRCGKQSKTGWPIYKAKLLRSSSTYTNDFLSYIT